MPALPRTEADAPALRAALRRAPNDPALHNALANVLHASGKSADATRHYRRALRHAPDSALLHFNLANALAAAGQPDQALETFRRAIALDDQSIAAHTNSGTLLRRLGRPAEALESYRRALHLSPGSAAARYNLATALLDLARPREALPYLEYAARANPPHHPAYASAGEAHLRLGHRAAALAWFLAALDARPDDRPARMGAGVCQLAAGDFSNGWPNFEARLDDPRIRLPALAGHRLQPGEPVAGKTIVLLPEQGLGDTLHFIRYARNLRTAGARVAVLAPPELRRLLEHSAIADEFVSIDSHPPRWDAVCPMLSLPHIFRTTLETIPADLPYLHPPPDEITRWQHRLGPLKGRRIGLVWSGSPSHMMDAERSIPLASLAPLLAVPGLEFHALQKPIRPADQPLPAAITPHAEDLTDFAATAGLVAALDLVISVDTSVAHLAGAMARPVWILLADNADFRWLERRRDSPWYPTARLYRQQTPGDWHGVIARVAADLAAP